MTDQGSGLSSLWQRPITKSFVFYSLLIYFLGHLLLWIGASVYSGRSLSSILMRWDSGWYSSIVDHGYASDPLRWAFFPLYPLLVRLLHWSFLGAIPTQVVGTLLSILLFLAAISLLLNRKLWPDPLFSATTRLGWLLFLFSPGSYIFHSHHTESLFLFLSICSFYFAAANKWIRGSIFAGLAAVTRIPGIFAAIAVACMSGRKTDEKMSHSARVSKFAISGLIGGLLIFSHWCYATGKTGDPLVIVKKQAGWFYDGELSLLRIVRTLWFGNESQIGRYNVQDWWYSASQALYFLLLSAGAVGIWKRNKCLALYAFLCLLAMLVQGSFDVAFRIGAVLFPVFFYLGARLSQLPRSIQWIFLAAWLTLNCLVAARFAMDVWAY